MLDLCELMQLVSVEHMGCAMLALSPSQQHMNVSLEIPLGLMLAHFLHRETQKLCDATVTPHRAPFAQHARS